MYLVNKVDIPDSDHLAFSEFRVVLKTQNFGQSKHILRYNIKFVFINFRC